MGKRKGKKKVPPKKASPKKTITPKPGPSSAAPIDEAAAGPSVGDENRCPNKSSTSKEPNDSENLEQNDLENPEQESSPEREDRPFMRYTRCPDPSNCTRNCKEEILVNIEFGRPDLAQEEESDEENEDSEEESDSSPSPEPQRIQVPDIHIDFPENDEEDFTFQPEMLTDIEAASGLQRSLKRNLYNIQYLRTHYRGDKNMKMVSDILPTLKMTIQGPDRTEHKLMRLNDLLRLMPYNCLESRCERECPGARACLRNGKVLLMIRMERIELITKEFLIGKKYTAVTRSQIFRLYNEILKVSTIIRTFPNGSNKLDRDINSEIRAKSCFYHAIVASRLNFMEESLEKITEVYKMMRKVLDRLDKNKLEEGDKLWKEELARKVKIQYGTITTKYNRFVDDVEGMDTTLFLDIPQSQSPPSKEFRRLGGRARLHNSVITKTYGCGLLLPAAADRIPPGQVIAHETSYYVTFTNFAKNEEDDWTLRRCLTCLEITYLLIPCPNCSNGLFCSAECIEDHDSECIIGFLPRLGYMLAKKEFFKMGSPAIAKQAALVMKIISIYGKEFFLKRCRHDPISGLDPQVELISLIVQVDDYDYTYRMAKLWAEYSMYLLNILRDSGYFKDNVSRLPRCRHWFMHGCQSTHSSSLPSISDELTMDEFAIFKWIFRLFAVVNRHSLELEEVGSRADQLDELFDPKNHHFTQPVGKGIFPAIASTFRHDCNPNCFVICGPHSDKRAGKMMVVTMRSISPGDELTIDQGFNYIHHPLLLRQFVSRFKFGHHCNCRACFKDCNFDLLPEKDPVDFADLYIDRVYDREPELEQLNLGDKGVIGIVRSLFQYAKSVAFFTKYKDLEGNDQLLYIVRLLLDRLDHPSLEMHVVLVRLRAMLIHMMKMRALSPESQFTSSCWLDKIREVSSVAWLYVVAVKHAENNMNIPDAPKNKFIVSDEETDFECNQTDAETYRAREVNIVKQHRVSQDRIKGVGHSNRSMDRLPYMCNGPVPDHPFISAFREPRKTIKISMGQVGVPASTHEYDLGGYDPSNDI